MSWNAGTLHYCKGKTCSDYIREVIIFFFHEVSFLDESILFFQK